MQAGLGNYITTFKITISRNWNVKIKHKALFKWINWRGHGSKLRVIGRTWRKIWGAKFGSSVSPWGIYLQNDWISHTVFIKYALWWLSC
jgi:hypothetical protein